MKKLFAILAFFLLFTIGCKEDSMKLSEFIIGEWDSELTAINPGEEDETLVYFYAKFSADNKFDLDFLSYPEKTPIFTFDDLNYTINSEFNLTIDNPMVEGKTVDFNIVWNPDYDKMVWVPEPDPEDNPPTMVFTKR